VLKQDYHQQVEKGE